MDSESKQFSFDKIATRYDTANRLISLGMDKSWRRRLLAMIPRESGLRMLDIACGTGDIAITARDRYINITELTALDVSEGMLNVARKRAGKRDINFIHVDMHELPFPDSSFDCISLVFGLRNALDPKTAIMEIERVLAPGGTALIMEFTMPQMPVFKQLFELYFHHIMPLIGGVVTGDRQAYSYLYQSVKDFLQPDELLGLLREKGFDTQTVNMAMSTVWIYNCRKLR